MGEVQGEIVHCAGLPLRIENQVRQRCAWCGTVLIDVDLANRPATILPENIIDPFGGLNVFPIGALVRVKADGELFVTVAGPDGEVPTDSCMQLPTFLTVDSGSGGSGSDGGSDG